MIRVPTLGKPLPPHSPMGTPVTLLLADGRVVHTKTRAPAQRLGGELVIWVDGVSGGWSVDRVRVEVDPLVVSWEGA